MTALVCCKLVHLLVPFFIAVNILVSFFVGILRCSWLHEIVLVCRAHRRVPAPGRAYEGGSHLEQPEGKSVVEQGGPCTAPPYRVGPCRARPCMVGTGTAPRVVGQILFSFIGFFLFRKMEELFIHCKPYSSR